MKSCVGGLIFGVVVVALLAACQTFTTMTYYCSECATERCEIQIRPFGMRSLGALGRKLTPSKWTRLVESVDPGPCNHRWVFVQGSGGAYL